MRIHNHWISRLILALWMLASTGCASRRGYVVRGNWSLELNCAPGLGMGPHDGMIDDSTIIQDTVASRQSLPEFLPVEPEPSRFFPVPTRPVFAPPAMIPAKQPTKLPAKLPAKQPEEIEPPPPLPESTGESLLQSIVQPPVAPSPGPAVSIRQPYVGGVQAAAWRSTPHLSERDCCEPSDVVPRRFHAAPALDIAESWPTTASRKPTYLSVGSRWRSLKPRR